MQGQFNDNWNKIYQSLSKPLADLTELNVNTLTNWSKNKGYFDELTQAKKPEDVFTTQMKLANIAQIEAMTYAKKVGAILVKAIEDWNEIGSEATSHKSQE